MAGQQTSTEIDFASLVAHELKNPLTSLISYLSVLNKENQSNLTEEQKLYLARITASTNQLIALVENLLNASRIDRGVFELSLESTDWVNQVREVVGLFITRAEERKIELIFQEPDSPIPTVKVDKVKIGEVLSNLLSNAINYTSENGKITVTIEAKDVEVITRVTDTGRGISKEDQEKLFTKFFRSESLRLEKPSGMGLGLFITKTIVEMHKGKIWVNSELDKGTTFSFSLPLA